MRTVLNLPPIRVAPVPRPPAAQMAPQQQRRAAASRSSVTTSPRAAAAAAAAAPPLDGLLRFTSCDAATRRKLESDFAVYLSSIAVHTCANEAQPQAFPTHARTPAPGTMEPRWLIFDVLDCGPGLRDVTESVLFADFTAPIGVHTASEGSPDHGTRYRSPRSS
jgi:hypothetical protein